MTEHVTIRGAAERLGVSPDTIRRRITRGQLQAVKEPRPQGFVWMVELPAAKAKRQRSSRRSPRPRGPSPAELEAAHLRDKVELLTTELDSRRREVSELHQLLAQSQLLLTAGKATEDETTTVEVREAPQEPPPRPPVRRRLTLRERVLGYARRK